MERVKFVLVGTGNIAGTYVTAVSRLNQAEIVGVVSRDAGRAQEYADVHSLGKGAGSLQDFDPDSFDAVMLATPNGLHHRDTLTAAELGKHVLTEKPLDVTLPKMDEMIRACRQADVQLGVAFQRRTSPANVAIKRLLEEGRLGNLYAADLSVKFFRGQEYYDSADWRGTKEVDGGGPFIQQASHNLDTITWFFGLPERVIAKTALLAHTRIEVEDHGAAILTYPGGMVATIIASTVTKPGYPVRLEIHAGLGSVLTVNDEIVTWDVENVPQPRVETSGAVHSGAGAGGAAVSDTSGHESIIADFCEAVRTGRDPIVSGEEARKTGLVIDTIYRAAEEGREIELTG